MAMAAAAGDPSVGCALGAFGSLGHPGGAGAGTRAGFGAGGGHWAATMDEDPGSSGGPLAGAVSEVWIGASPSAARKHFHITLRVQQHKSLSCILYWVFWAHQGAGSPVSSYLSVQEPHEVLSSSTALPETSPPCPAIGRRPAVMEYCDLGTLQVRLLFSTHFASRLIEQHASSLAGTARVPYGRGVGHRTEQQSVAGR